LAAKVGKCAECDDSYVIAAVPCIACLVLDEGEVVSVWPEVTTCHGTHSMPSGHHLYAAALQQPCRPAMQTDQAACAGCKAWLAEHMQHTRPCTAPCLGRAAGSPRPPCCHHQRPQHQGLPSPTALAHRCCSSPRLRHHQGCRLLVACCAGEPRWGPAFAAASARA
jgi:hypothetical protein